MLSMINLLCYRLTLFNRFKIRVTETNIYETGKTILIDYALANSAIKRYRIVLMSLCWKMVANNKFATKSRETLEPFVY